MRRISILIASAAALAVAVPAFAGPVPPNFGGSFDSQSSMGFLAVSKHGRIAKVKHFEWDGLNCGSDRFTAGLDRHKIFKVDSDRRFHGKAKVTGVNPGVSITGKVKGRFNRKGTKAHGTLKLTGDCETKQAWTANQIAE